MLSRDAQEVLSNVYISIISNIHTDKIYILRFTPGYIQSDSVFSLSSESK